jgi:hypothetical protein
MHVIPPPASSAPVTIDLRTDHMSLWRAIAYLNSEIGPGHGLHHSSDWLKALEGSGIFPAYIAPSGGKVGYVKLYRQADIQQLALKLRPKPQPCIHQQDPQKQKRLFSLSQEEAQAVRTNPPKVMNLFEAAAYLHYSPRKVRDLVRLRRIPAINLSGEPRAKLLFRLEDLEAVLARQSRTAL